MDEIRPKSQDMSKEYLWQIRINQAISFCYAMLYQFDWMGKKKKKSSKYLAAVKFSLRK